MKGATSIQLHSKVNINMTWIGFNRQCMLVHIKYYKIIPFQLCFFPSRDKSIETIIDPFPQLSSLLVKETDV